MCQVLQCHSLADDGHAGDLAAGRFKTLAGRGQRPSMQLVSYMDTQWRFGQGRTCSQDALGQVGGHAHQVIHDLLVALPAQAQDLVVLHARSSSSCCLAAQLR